MLLVLRVLLCVCSTFIDDADTPLHPQDLDTLYELLSLSPHGPKADGDPDTDGDEGDLEWPYKDRVRGGSTKMEQSEERKEDEERSGMEEKRENDERGHKERGSSERKGEERDQGTQKQRKERQKLTVAHEASTSAPLSMHPPGHTASLSLPLPPPPLTSQSSHAVVSTSPHGERDLLRGRVASPPTSVSTSHTASPTSARTHTTTCTHSSTSSVSTNPSSTPLATLQRRRAARLERVFRVSYRELFECMVLFPVESKGEGEVARGRAGVGRSASASAGTTSVKVREGAGQGKADGVSLGKRQSKEEVGDEAGSREGLGNGKGAVKAPGKGALSMMTVAAVAKVAAMAAGAGTTIQGERRDHTHVPTQEKSRKKRPRTAGEEPGETGSMRSKNNPPLRMVPVHASMSNIRTLTPTPEQPTMASKARSALHRRSASLDLLTQMREQGPGQSQPQLPEETQDKGQQGKGQTHARNPGSESGNGSTSTYTLASASSSSSSSYPSTPADDHASPPPLPTHPLAHSTQVPYQNTASRSHPHVPPTITTTTTTTPTPENVKINPLFYLPDSFRDTTVPPSPPPFAGYPAKDKPDVGYEFGHGGGDGRTTPTPAHVFARKYPSTTTAVHVQRNGMIKRVVGVSRGTTSPDAWISKEMNRKRSIEDMQGVMNRLRELR